MKIAIEGMDGVGKSTIAQKLSNEYGYKYIEKPLTELMHTSCIDGKSNLSDISNNIYSVDNEIIKAWFFGLGNLYTFLKYQDQDVIIDRHFASNYFWNGTERTNEIFKTMINLIGTPDITIVLYASAQTRLSRIYKRNPNDYDLSDTEKHVLGYDKMFQFLDEFDIPYVVIDTENKNEDMVYAEVDDIIKNMQSNKQLIKK